MKHIPCLLAGLLAVIFFTSCSKTLPTEQLTDSQYITLRAPVAISQDMLEVSAEVTGNPKGTISEYGFLWTGDGSSPFSESTKIQMGNSASTGVFSTRWDVSYPDLTYAIRAYVVIDGQYFYSSIYRYSSLPRGSWNKLSDFPGVARSFPFYFALNGKGYMGCGWNGSEALKDFWEFDPATAQWTRLADFPGRSRSAGFNFVIGNKAYAGGGAMDNPILNHSLLLKDFYSFDANSKSWVQLQDFPSRQYFLADGICGTYHFALGGFGFVGGGELGYQNIGYGLLRYDAAADSWTPFGANPLDYHQTTYKISFPAWFVIADTAYIGTGNSQSINGDSNDSFFKYFHKTNTWQSAGFTPRGSRTYSVGFENSGFGYIGFDFQAADLWQYQYSATDPPFKPTSRSPGSYLNKGGIAFTFGNKTFLGLGETPGVYWNPKSMFVFTPTR